VQLEAVEVGEGETADAQTRQGEQMGAADAAQTGDRHAFGAQHLLLALGDPAQVSLEGRS
jgi:hypothetical protein